MINKKIWDDQTEFNLQVRPEGQPGRHDELSAVTKEFTLHMMTEMAEFLDAGKVFGAHRRRDIGFINRENVRRQLIDQLKYWMSIAQAWGFTREELERTYWAKSATVRQRFSEEWMLTLDRELVVLDLDGVMCDFTHGFCNWLFPLLGYYAGNHDLSKHWWMTLNRILANREYLSAVTTKIPVDKWNQIQHDFRSSGETAKLPALPGAKQLVKWCRDMDYAVVAVTSRPIGEYPNLYDDTVQWFNEQGLQVDRIWWGTNKAEKLAAIPNLPPIRFAVEDEPRYVEQLMQLGVPRIYWYKHGYNGTVEGPGIVPIINLEQITKEESIRKDNLL